MTIYDPDAPWDSMVLEYLHLLDSVNVGTRPGERLHFANWKDPPCY